MEFTLEEYPATAKTALTADIIEIENVADEKPMVE